jgi:hypothetical protein
MKTGDKYHKDGKMYTIEEIDYDNRKVFFRSSCGKLDSAKFDSFVTQYSQWVPTIAQQCAVKSK